MNSSVDLVTIVPVGSFVIKTRLQTGTSSPKHRLVNAKVFVNVCTSPEVPLPHEKYDPPATYKLIMENQWEIPIVTSEEREDKDKKGQLSYVYDCVINDEAMKWAQRDPQLREILMEWCMESVEVRSDLMLGRGQVSVPKMVSKGTPVEIKLLKSELEGKNESQDEPSDFLSIKRAVDDELMDIRVGYEPVPSTKPLIQEISEMTIKDRVERKRTIIKKRDATAPKEKLKYSTSMSKTDINGYKLRIEIASQNASSLDYTLDLDRTTNTLILKNQNPEYHAVDLELPLPSVFEFPELKTFFLAKDHKLVIFVK
jgi:hypothetical protein